MDQFSDVVGLNLLLDKAPGHPIIWNRFLKDLILQLSCDSAALLVSDLIDNGNTHFLFSVHIRQEYQEQYENKLNKLDKFNHFIGKNPHRVYYNQAVKEMFQVESNSEFIPPHGQQYRFGLSIPCNHKHALSLQVNRKTAFDEDEQQRITGILQSIIPSLDDAIHAEQRHKINSQARLYLGGYFDSYIIVDHKLNIIFSDPIYTAIINQMDCVQIDGNRFGMRNRAIEQQLLSLIENNQGAKIPNHCQACQIMLIPISSLTNLYQWECYNDGFILSFTHDKEKNPAIDRLTEIYHLSQCEAVCALHFMHTPSISDIATNTFRSQETVRNHIKHAMQKMEVHSQAELMKKLITLTSL